MAIVVILLLSAAYLLMHERTATAKAVSTSTTVPKLEPTGNITASPLMGKLNRYISSRDLSGCHSLIAQGGFELRDICFYGISVATSNASLCGLIQNESVKNKCRAVTAKNVSSCEVIADAAAKSRCIKELAWATKNQSLCGTSGVTRGDQDTCYYILAQQMSDPTLCSKIKEINFSDHCKTSMERNKAKWKPS